jgi:RNA polymerase sigma-70 factor (ECF subfamily)
MPQRFSTTRWSLVLAARHGSSPAAREALSTLCGLYWYPLYAFTRRQGHGPDDAHDRVQGFFTRLLEKNQLGTVDRQRGRFRSWLRASLHHYLCNEWDREHTLKRGSGEPLVSLDATTAQEKYRLEPSHELTLERLFERRWALTLLEQVLGILGEEYTRTGKGPLFEGLKGTLTGEAGEVSYQWIATELGSTPGAVEDPVSPRALDSRSDPELEAV